jgi:hypothetical protein
VEKHNNTENKEWEFQLNKEAKVEEWNLITIWHRPL